MRREARGLGAALLSAAPDGPVPGGPSGRPGDPKTQPPVALSLGPSGLPITLTALPSAPLAATAPTPPPVHDRLPQSRVKPEFENSGRYLDDTQPAR